MQDSCTRITDRHSCLECLRIAYELLKATCFAIVWRYKCFGKAKLRTCAEHAVWYWATIGGKFIIATRPTGASTTITDCAGLHRRSSTYSKREQIVMISFFMLIAIRNWIKPTLAKRYWCDTSLINTLHRNNFRRANLPLNCIHCFVWLVRSRDCMISPLASAWLSATCSTNRGIAHLAGFIVVCRMVHSAELCYGNSWIRRWRPNAISYTGVKEGFMDALPNRGASIHIIGP